MIRAFYPWTAVENHAISGSDSFQNDGFSCISLNSVPFLNDLTEPAYDIGLVRESSLLCVVTTFSYELHIIMSPGTIYLWSPTRN